ncbi:NAD(P)H-dependent oxidoreductase [Brucella gallinifaecis]|uniref:NAD(P)H-dependent oxidoreductase n=1 Tax=Brucella gallinifaecis TaxID=215590 RepID=UPI0023621059|nr:NAD(P)H-dependent oxidoreductase [Brucella gallinifaecis]
MTNVLFLYAHPEPTSFCAAMISEALKVLENAGHDVKISDLYAKGFNPVGGRLDFKEQADPNRFHYQTEQAHAARTGSFADDIATEQELVLWADVFVPVFPLWWGNPPAILKGWYDRVLAYGFGYVDGARFDTGLFRGRRAMLAISTGGTPARFTDEGPYGPIDKVLWSSHHLILGYMGFACEEPFVAYAAPRVSQEERDIYKRDFAQKILSMAEKPVDRNLREENPLARVGENAWAAVR